MAPRETLMSIRSFFGTICIIFGILNILDFWSPHIPTMGPTAFIVGFFFIGLGAYLRSARNEGGKIDWGRLRSVLSSRFQSGSGRNGKMAEGEKTLRDPLLAVRALRLASERKGLLTLAQTAIELNAPIDQAELALDECVRKGSAFIEVDQATGIASYRFPEFAATQT
jgi:hypothetical protein